MGWDLGHIPPAVSPLAGSGYATFNMISGVIRRLSSDTYVALVIWAIDVYSVPARGEADVHLDILVQDCRKTWLLSGTSINKNSLI